MLAFGSSWFIYMIGKTKYLIGWKWVMFLSCGLWKWLLGIFTIPKDIGCGLLIKSGEKIISSTTTTTLEIGSKLWKLSLIYSERLSPQTKE